MNLQILTIISLSILIAGVIGLIRYKFINKLYYPFLYVIWFACITEILGITLAYNNLSGEIITNIYVLIEAVFLLFLFRNILALKPALFYSILIMLLIIWFYDNIWRGKLYAISSYFRIAYAFVIVLLSISTVNKLIGTVRTNLFMNPVFLLSTGFIIYFTFKILVEAFWIYGIHLSRDFQIVLYNIILYINLFTNLIYALAILWMPKKQIFTMPSS